MSERPGRWPQGEAEIETLLDRGELELVTPSHDHAQLLMEQAEGHLEAAGPLVERHPPSAYSLLYDGARKAMTAVLAAQGLRPTRTGGHLVVQDAIEAQLGPNIRHIVRPFRQLRKRRNESEYPTLDHPPLTDVEAREGLADASRILESMRGLMPRVGPFV